MAGDDLREHVRPRLYVADSEPALAVLPRDRSRLICQARMRATGSGTSRRDATPKIVGERESKTQIEFSSRASPSVSRVVAQGNAARFGARRLAK